MQHNIYPAIIIDDEADARSALLSLIDRFCPNLEVCAEAGTVEEAQAAIQQHQPAIVFLDIDLRNGSGFDVLEAFPKPNFKVVFVTAHDDYAIEAFKVRALHYLLKPIDPEDLVRATCELQTRDSFWPEYEALHQDLATNTKRKLALPTVQGTALLSAEEIIFAFADEKYVTVVLNTGEKIFAGFSLKELEAKLPIGEFVRSHQSYIVRIDAVRRLRKADGLFLVLKDKTEIPVSRRNQKMVLRVLGMA